MLSADPASRKRDAPENSTSATLDAVTSRSVTPLHLVGDPGSTANAALPDRRTRYAWLVLVIDKYGVKLNPFALTVYLCLLRHANREARAWPSQGRIARMVKMGRRSVNVAIRDLRAAGLITVGRMKRTKTRLYTLHDPASCAPRAQEGQVLCATRTATCAPRAQGSEDSIEIEEFPLPPRGGREVREKKPAGTLTCNFPIPEPLNCASFTDAWEEWRRYKLESRRPLSSTTIRAQLKKLAAWGPEKAVASIRQSIEHGWAGLFEPGPVGESEEPGRSAETKQQRDQRVLDQRRHAEEERRGSAGGMQALADGLKKRG
jgi:hypothetical protein